MPNSREYDQNAERLEDYMLGKLNDLANSPEWSETSITGLPYFMYDFQTARPWMGMFHITASDDLTHIYPLTLYALMNDAHIGFLLDDLLAHYDNIPIISDEIILEKLLTDGKTTEWLSESTWKVLSRESQRTFNLLVI